jgi:hypothetical protein
MHLGCLFHPAAFVAVLRHRAPEGRRAPSSDARIGLLSSVALAARSAPPPRALPPRRASAPQPHRAPPSHPHRPAEPGSLCHLAVLLHCTVHSSDTGLAHCKVECASLAVQAPALPWRPGAMRRRPVPWTAWCALGLAALFGKLLPSPAAVGRGRLNRERLRVWCRQTNSFIDCPT